jgi:hypothetical protein
MKETKKKGISEHINGGTEGMEMEKRRKEWI